MKPANPAKLNIYLSPQHGGQQLVEMRLQITHKQWIFHNSSSGGSGGTPGNLQEDGRFDDY